MFHQWLIFGTKLMLCSGRISCITLVQKILFLFSILILFLLNFMDLILNFWVLQRRHARSHLKVILFPAILFILLGALQSYSNKADRGDKVKPRVGTEFPPLLQIPSPPFRAVMTDSMPFTGLPDASCRGTGSCPATVLITGNNRTIGESIRFLLLLVRLASVLW